jgi:predicted flap endonuclease-1-like 5' DNA nuclease
MPINRELESIDDHGTEESAVRRTPLDQEEAYELQDHEFTLVAEEPVEKSGWPFDEHTAPWSTLPPLPAWATKARALLEPPTLPRPLNDETPTLVEDDGSHFSATALRALREELAQSARDAHSRQEHIDQLERSLASAVQARADAELKRGVATAELLGRVQGQALRIRELEAAVRDLQVVRIEPVVAEAAPRISKAEVRDTRAESPTVTNPDTEVVVSDEAAIAASALDVTSPAELAIAASDAEVKLADELQGVASDSDSDLETTVEWITNAAPSVEVTIEIDPNDDNLELSSTVAASETTLEIDPDVDLMEADAIMADVVETTPADVAAASGPTRGARTRASTAKRRPRAGDDLKLIAGIGKRLEQRLNENGIRTFAKIAAFSSADVARVAKQLGVSPERIAREGWVRQARKLKKRPAKRAARRKRA